VSRVQEWRKAHPGYSGKKTGTLQDRLSGQDFTMNELAVPQALKTRVEVGRYYPFFSNTNFATGSYALCK
jgi:hypothetical protein